MNTVNLNDVEIDRCDKCHGLFFDHLETEILRSVQVAASIEIDDKFVGARLNEILDVACPKCQTKMEHVLHTDPFEIKFERCPACKGIYFDAGEFRDYLEDEIYQQFQKVIEQL